MKTIITDLGEYKPEYPIELLADPAEVLFMDIETTGLTPANTNLYLIGCAYFENDEWHVVQWFAEKYEEELTLLSVKFTREKLMSLNLAMVDPSDALSQFECNMKFKKTAGFDPVNRVLA